MKMFVFLFVLAYADASICFERLSQQSRRALPGYQRKHLQKLSFSFYQSTKSYLKISEVI